jgi:hypothetical protein
VADRTKNAMQDLYGNHLSRQEHSHHPRGEANQSRANKKLVWTTIDDYCRKYNPVDKIGP